MHVNKLKDMKPFTMKKFILRSLGDEAPFPDTIEESDIRVFDLDQNVKDGRLGLVYNNNVFNPQIYFQDLSGD